MSVKSSARFDPPDGLYLLFSPHRDAESPYVTLRPHWFHSEVTSVVVPAGFRCDFASVPRVLLWLFDPKGRHQRAAMFHDACYRRRLCTRWEADAIFRAIMAVDGVAGWRRLLLYYAVRLFGGRAWKAWAKRSEEHEAG